MKKMQTQGKITAVSPNKGEAEVVCGSMKLHCRLSDLMIIGSVSEHKEKVRVIRNIPVSRPLLEINVLGMTVEEALYEVDNFIDKAVTDNLSEIKIIHGVGTGRLKAAISQHLKKNRIVESYRLGKYGEGETGVTIITLK